MLIPKRIEPCPRLRHGSIRFGDVINMTGNDCSLGGTFVRRLIGLTSTVILTVSTTPWPGHVARPATSDVPGRKPGLTTTGIGKMRQVLQNRRIKLMQLSGPKDEPTVVYSLANNRMVRVSQTGFPDMVTGHAIPTKHYRPRAKPTTPPPAVYMAEETPTSRATTLQAAANQTPAATTVSMNVSTSANTGLTIAKYALNLVGSPYVWGGDSPGGFDCSGLASYVYAMAHIPIPRTSFEQYTVGTPVAEGSLLPGDLVFFDTDGGGASHVAIYVGNGLIVQALNQSTGVIVSHLSDSYYAETYVGARRRW